MHKKSLTHRIYAVTMSVLVSAGATACTTRDADNEQATSAATASTPAPMAVDTGMGNMPGMDMTGDADHDFLRMMADHHKGLILMVHQTVDRKDKLGVMAIARRLDTEQDAELDGMTTMLEKDFNDPYAPKVMPEHQAMADELKGKSGADYDGAFLQNIVKHHEEAIKMIDEYLPEAKAASVKSMAEKMKGAQSKAIAEFKAKLAK